LHDVNYSNSPFLWQLSIVRRVNSLTRGNRPETETKKRQQLPAFPAGLPKIPIISPGLGKDYLVGKHKIL